MSIKIDRQLSSGMKMSAPDAANETSEHMWSFASAELEKKNQKEFSPGLKKHG